MPQHTLAKHTNCEIPYCGICDGGLALCTTCHGGEGSLPTDCPGVGMTNEQVDAVYQARLDYRDDEGGWVNKPAKHWERTNSLNAEINRRKRIR